MEEFAAGGWCKFARESSVVGGVRVRCVESQQPNAILRIGVTTRGKITLGGECV